ncbi:MULTISPECIES: sirohydrochlorin chelatase [unclassified Microbacterium]|uniref:sirohydrochlorin chelatase n=1 Tax=unclassified Microbacterium TaxID=2609290 RepID=UPI000CFE1473|nr:MULTISPECIES: CbiX/SirB N-terminal domain-containing protein [unclassified Microbacterium]PQZ61000.1 cobalamin biosynthesis protein CbiX [Microbacterium sp. MYb43]PQZ82209.1 cobalamin biosynthesis protein CbiX [Microbacterium sp. MYb40]PRB24090.1 cobalamin biosynthesis protein CbiX [Microbacterium sp. MYb54]PRB30921.1 cobalamin biosynthesis protein CbiX [Microbacterium sp. MYb50]PRB70657.1 cobalamin biosynthesis protein CbiX [Microbacterium sp. MYb24]
MTTLVACSHGTDSPDGRRAVADIVDLVRLQIPGTRIVQAFVDVQEPEVGEIVDRERADDVVVVVPLLLSVGFHTAVDIARAVHPYDNARQAEPLGTHPLIADVLHTRLRAVVHDWLPGDHVVLAAAGSSNPAAVADVEAAAAHLRALIPAPVTIGYASAIDPRIADAVSAARRDGATRVIAASHVLAPGYFAGLVERAGADLVAAPLGADPRIAQVIVERFRSA